MAAPQNIFCLKSFLSCFQTRIAQLVAYRLGTGEVPGSNLDKGKNFSVKIIYIIQNIQCTSTYITFGVTAQCETVHSVCRLNVDTPGRMVDDDMLSSC